MSKVQEVTISKSRSSKLITADKRCTELLRSCLELGWTEEAQYLIDMKIKATKETIKEGRRLITAELQKLSNS